MICVEFKVMRRKVCPTCHRMVNREDGDSVETQYWLARSLQDALRDESGSKFCGLSVISFQELDMTESENVQARATNFAEVARRVYKPPYAFKLNVPEGV